MLAIQYLEDRPELLSKSSSEVRNRLQAAFGCLPISILILGWNVPKDLYRTCADEAARAGAKLYRWHPLLTGSAALELRPEWQTIGLSGERVPGFRGLPEFTFVCPNCEPAAHAVLESLRQSIRKLPYQGIFLDRIRFPSPAADPRRFLACFCPGCQRAAQQEGLDLAEMRRNIQRALVLPENLPAVLRLLLDPSFEPTPGAAPYLGDLRQFLHFRQRSITRFVQTAAQVVRAEGLEVGLDCFSPVLTHLVGQDLSTLDPLCDWIKVMTYGHALGPAALPFEFTQLARWLAFLSGQSEQEVTGWLAQASGLPFPPSLSELGEQGLSPEALACEIHLARALGARRLLAGMELVEVPGVTRLSPPQMTADLRAFHQAGADGLALSWDLDWIPQERLELVKEVWGS